MCAWGVLYDLRVMPQSPEHDDFQVRLPRQKQHTENPRQPAAVVDNAHRTAVSSMSTRLGDSKLIEGYEKKRTGPSFGFSVEYVGFAEMHIRTLGLVGGTGHPASPLLP